MWLLYPLTVVAIALAITAMLGAIVVIVAHAVRQRLKGRRDIIRKRLLNQILGGIDNEEWQPALVEDLSRDMPLSVDLFSELTELIRGDNRARIEKLCRDAGMDEWLRARMRSNRREARRLAAESLRLFPDALSISALETALDDRAPNVRMTAAISLAELNVLPSVRTILSKVVEAHQHQTLQLQRLFESLARTRPSEIMEIAQGDLGAKFTRPIAIRALGTAGHTDLGPRLQTLIGDPDPEVRAAALDAVAALGCLQAQPNIRCALSDDVSFVRVRAIECARQLDLQELAPIIADLATDTDWWTRFRAEEALLTLTENGSGEPHTSSAKLQQRGAA